MTIDFSTLPYNQIIWGAVIVLGIILAVVVIRFFWQHIVKYLVQGCLVIIVLLGLLALLHYLKVF